MGLKWFIREGKSHHIRATIHPSRVRLGFSCQETPDVQTSPPAPTGTYPLWIPSHQGWLFSNLAPSRSSKSKHPWACFGQSDLVSIQSFPLAPGLFSLFADMGIF